MPKFKNSVVDYNEICELFKTREGRYTLITDYSNKIDKMLAGTNQYGEGIVISINNDSIVLTTYQKNGFIRINYYDEYGYDSGEEFKGRWDKQY